MRVKVTEAGRAYYNYGIVEFAKGDEMSGGFALHLLETGTDVEPVDEAAEEWLAAQGAPPVAEQESDKPPTGLDVDATAADVLTWVGDDPERAAEALVAEQESDKPRSTLVKQLEKLVGSGE